MLCPFSCEQNREMDNNTKRTLVLLTNGDEQTKLGWYAMLIAFKNTKINRNSKKKIRNSFAIELKVNIIGGNAKKNFKLICHISHNHHLNQLVLNIV